MQVFESTTSARHVRYPSVQITHALLHAGLPFYYFAFPSFSCHTKALAWNKIKQTITTKRLMAGTPSCLKTEPRLRSRIAYPLFAMPIKLSLSKKAGWSRRVRTKNCCRKKDTTISCIRDNFFKKKKTYYRTKETNRFCSLLRHRQIFNPSLLFQLMSGNKQF